MFSLLSILEAANNIKSVKKVPQPMTKNRARDNRFKQILAHLANGHATRDEISAATGLNMSTLYGDLINLECLGMIEICGHKNKKTNWKLTKKGKQSTK